MKLSGLTSNAVFQCTTRLPSRRIPSEHRLVVSIRGMNLYRRLQDDPVGCRDLRCFAKKSKKKSKQSLLPTIPKKSTTPWMEIDIINLLLFMIESYSKQTSKPLLDEAEISKIATEIYEASFCLLIHDSDLEKDDSPRFLYANRAALEMMEASWDDVVGTQSTFFEKATLKEVSEKGFIGGLSTKVKTLGSTELELQDVEVVNITSLSDEAVGQMMIFKEWTLEDGTVVGAKEAVADEIESEDKTDEEAQEAEGTTGAPEINEDSA